MLSDLAVEEALAAGLTDALPELLRVLDERAAGESDITHLLASIRVAARINYDTPAGSGTRRWNYSEPIEVNIP